MTFHATKLPAGLAACMLFLFIYTGSNAQQSTGKINRPANIIAGRTVLDPNGDGFTSATSAGYGTSDVINSEIPYRSVPSFSAEPFGDLRRGPSHLYSDFVPDASNVGYYTYFSGTNMLFRFRMGSIMPGSKGYSVLLDTDGKFGATGANADPDYQAATTGTNGNPGFEIEIVLETNSRIAIYNVNGSSTPTLVKAYTAWQDMSQVSIAGTFDNGDPDFFIDFYVPFADLTAAPFSLTTTSSIRMSATTVMSAQAATGGPKSDLYGLNDAGYKSTNDEYEAYINAQPAFTLASLTTGSIGTMCTAAPTLNTPITTGATSVSGTWTKSTLSGAVNTATIKIYNNGTYTGKNVLATSGVAWTVSGLTALASGAVITAKAVATGESECLSSNAVTVSSCNSTNRPALPVLSCYTTTKGITGTNLSTGWTVHVDNLSKGTQENNVANTTTAAFGTTTTGTSPNITWTYSNGCASGSPVTGGSYKVYYTNNVTGCVSEPAYVCATGNGGTALAGTLNAPTITAPAGSVFTTATNTISGTTQATTTSGGTAMTLYVDGFSVATTTASATSPYSFSFTNLKLLQGQTVYITNEYNTGTQSSSYCESKTLSATVVCYTTAPLINSDNNSQITAGAAITGTSGEAAGTTIKVYTSANTLVATTTVQSSGTWSTANSGTTPATYVAVSGTTYYATAQNGSCGVSTASDNVTAASATTGRCGTITGPVNSAALTVSGSVTGSFTTTTINLYLDGTRIGSTSTNNTAWGPISVSNLYANGVLTIGVQETGKQEQYCSSSATTITCSTGPATPNVSPSTSSLSPGQTQTYTVNNAVSGAFYGLADATTGKSLGTGVWATSTNISLTTDAFTTGNYSVVVKGTSLTGVSVCSSAPATTSILVGGAAVPLQLIDFSGKKTGTAIILNWVTENEINTSYFEIERADNGIGFRKLAQQNVATGTGQKTYTYTDEHPLPGTNYYRLQMVDVDGIYTYSKIIAIRNDGSVVAVDRLSPNPFTDKFVISMVLEKKAQLKITLMDINGRLLKSKEAEGRNGTNNILFDNLHYLPRGIYLVQVRAENVLLQQKIIKTGN